VTVSFNNTATSGNLSVTATNGCGTSSARTIAITVNPLPTPSISGNNVVCEGSNEVYSTSATGNNFFWTVVSGGTIIPPNTNNSVTVTWSVLPSGISATGKINVTETTVPGGCSVTTPDYSVTIYRVPQTGPEYHIINTHNQ
jgi:hypothetical protein